MVKFLEFTNQMLLLNVIGQDVSVNYSLVLIFRCDK